MEATNPQGMQNAREHFVPVATPWKYHYFPGGLQLQEQELLPGTRCGLGSSPKFFRNTRATIGKLYKLFEYLAKIELKMKVEGSYEGFINN